jgi:3-phenylpropionate/trans-cinnamate dioxygenase ferredoxin reductase subunit
MGRTIVVGAGQAGSAAAAKLRTQGSTDEIVLIGQEQVPPYQRPPLSKKYLLGEMAVERLFLRPESFYADQNIELRLGSDVTALDRKAKTITVGDDVLSYDALILTTGSRPRRLPAAIGGDLIGVHEVRTLADVDKMAPGCREGQKVLIVGGGYIGLEAAAVTRKMGMDVKLVEMSERILQRVAAPATSDYFRALHRKHGVDLREGVGLDRIIGNVDGQVSGAILNDGTELAVDMVIVGVGIIPDTDLARDAGLDIALDGIAVDAQARTSDPSIWAAGDCTALPFQGQVIRLESVQNAIDQAEAAACNILGADTDYVPNPWFWSDQYDVKLQIAGLNLGYTDLIVRAGDDPTVVSHWYYRDATLLAVDAMNDPRNYMVGKRLIEAGKSPSRSAIADPATDMKALLRC